jgi:hypothetical protein
MEMVATLWSFSFMIGAQDDFARCLTVRPEPFSCNVLVLARQQAAPCCFGTS